MVADDLMTVWTLRANISETGLVLLINEQKGEKGGVRSCFFTNRS
jgi:hypothetical protein